MLQSSSSIETRASWVVASVALFIMMMAFGAAWITAVALKDIAAEAGGGGPAPAPAPGLARARRRGARDPGAGQRAGLARLRRRRHPDGPHRRPRRHTLDRDLRRADDRSRPVDLDAGSA